jgi:hypothetical protein
MSVFAFLVGIVSSMIGVGGGFRVFVSEASGCSSGTDAIAERWRSTAHGPSIAASRRDA